MSQWNPDPIVAILHSLCNLALHTKPWFTHVTVGKKSVKIHGKWEELCG